MKQSKVSLEFVLLCVVFLISLVFLFVPKYVEFRDDERMSDLEVMEEVCSRVATNVTSNYTQPYDYVIGDKNHLGACLFQGRVFVFSIPAWRGLHDVTD